MQQHDQLVCVITGVLTGHLTRIPVPLLNLIVKNVKFKFYKIVYNVYQITSHNKRSCSNK